MRTGNLFDPHPHDHDHLEEQGPRELWDPSAPLCEWMSFAEPRTPHQLAQASRFSLAHTRKLIRRGLADGTIERPGKAIAYRLVNA